MPDPGRNSGEPCEQAPVGSYPDTAVARFVEDPRQPAIVERVPVRTFIDDQQVGGPVEQPSQIIKPTAQDMHNLHRLHCHRFCGNCRYFRYQEGQAEIAKQRFFERMQREQGWKGGGEWTGDPRHYGICDDKGDTAVYYWAPVEPIPGEAETGCNNWRPSRGTIIRSWMGRSSS